MANLVDSIQRYLVGLLNNTDDGVVEIQRSELASRFGCVPSQINYVLETRFTFPRGYLVESRRGGGGYIRLIRLELDAETDPLRIVYEAVGDAVTQHTAFGYIGRLLDAGSISPREAAMLQAALHRSTLFGDPAVRDQQRARLFRSMLLALAGSHRRES